MDEDLTVDAVQALERALAQAAEEDQRVRQERRYRILFVVEAAALLLTPAWLIIPGLVTLIDAGKKVWAIGFSLFSLVHIVGIPCCLSYLIGRPILLGLTIDGPTPAGRVLIAELLKRPVLSDNEFFRRYFSDRGIPRSVVDGVRKVLRDIEPDCDRASPAFLLGYLLYDLDYADVYYRLAREFRVQRVELAKEHDGSIEWMIRDVMTALG